MEEIIEKLKQNYPNMYAFKVWIDGGISLYEQAYYPEGECFLEFDSLEDLRNHLNE